MISDFSSNAQNIARLKSFLVGVKKLKPLGVLSVIIENLPAITEKAIFISQNFSMLLLSCQCNDN